MWVFKHTVFWQSALVWWISFVHHWVLLFPFIFVSEKSFEVVAQFIFLFSRFCLPKSSAPKYVLAFLLFFQLLSSTSFLFFCSSTVIIRWHQAERQAGIVAIFAFHWLHLSLLPNCQLFVLIVASLCDDAVEKMVAKWWKHLPSLTVSHNWLTL